jgi:hypothetical protein
MAGDVYEVALDLSHDEYLPTSPAWLKHKQSLIEQLQKAEELTSVRRVETPVPGAKGGAAEIIVGLGQAGAFTVLAGAIRAWIARDTARGVDVVVRNAHGEVRFSAATMRDAELASLVEKLPGYLAPPRK